MRIKNRDPSEKGFEKKHSDVKHLSRKQLYRIYTKFEQYRTIGDRRKDMPVRKRTRRLDEYIEKSEDNYPEDSNEISNECI